MLTLNETELCIALFRIASGNFSILRLMFKITVFLMKPYLLWILCVQGEKTIVISSDGFRWDYYRPGEFPGIDQIRMHGVQVKNLINSFATVTFPNHFTLVTGLHEDHHGIIDNEMYDPQFDETFDMGTTDPKWWENGEPIWVTSTKAGLKSVCVNWVGCSIPIQDIRPTYWAPFDGSIDYKERVDTIADKINGDAELGLLYFEEPDHSCHIYGPESDQVSTAIKKVDETMQYLLKKVDLNNVNIIFTSDHGGYEVSNKRVVVLDSFTRIPFRLVARGAVGHLWPVDENTDFGNIMNDLDLINPDQARCFLKKDIPDRLHYSSNRRIAPVVCIATLGWTILKTHEEKDRFSLKGSHGYDSSIDVNSPMRPVFVAGGPSFKKQLASEPPFDPVQSIHVFPLLANLLNLRSESVPKVDGELESISIILKKSEGYDKKAEAMLPERVQF